MIVTFNDKVVRQFFIATVVWSLVSMLVGILIALQLNWYGFNGKIFGFGEGLEYITFGRLRPLHTNAAIFAFVGNMAFCGIYYSTQRLCKCRMASDLLSSIHFWGWQLIIVAAAITLPLGYTQSKEYAELIWPIDLAVVAIWVTFGVNFFWTLKKRNEPCLYVALWFYIATIITIALLYVVNNIQIPTSLLHSYPIFSGVQDALTQWWYGHNAVAFFLTTPILGIMYYYLPKAANRPVYSYRLSIVHFWSLVFIYIWAGPHHLLHTSLPKWLQMMGMLFSLMLWAPSWGGMLNGLLTLRGGWAQLRTDPVIKFFVVALTFYGMATLEGPLLSIRTVNQLSHYTDWTIGHVHGGTLGWNGYMAAAMLYWLAPRLWGRKLYSIGLANLHFWIGLIGILLYVSALWVSGVTQGLMLSATNPDGTTLTYKFIETVNATKLPMAFRAFGGLLYLSGFVLMAFNFYKTIKGSTPTISTLEVTPLRDPKDQMTLRESLLSDPVAHIFGILLFMILWFFLPPHADLFAMAMALIISARAIYYFKKNKTSWADFHERLTENYLPFTVLTLIAVAIGGVVQLVPSMMINKAENVEDRLQSLYTPLELAGRDIYVSEGCYNCHSQMIRTLLPDVARYGDYSRLGESIYDFPHQWGSKRTGPDLAREGGRQSDFWHYTHFVDPRALESDSTMPSFHFLAHTPTNFKEIPGRIKTQVGLGVPFTKNFPTLDKNEIEQHARDQALNIAKKLTENGAILPDVENATPAETTRTLSESKMVALIAYMQKLGSYEEVEPKVTGAEEIKPKLYNPDSNLQQNKLDKKP